MPRITEPIASLVAATALYCYATLFTMPHPLKRMFTQYRARRAARDEPAPLRLPIPPTSLHDIVTSDRHFEAISASLQMVGFIHVTPGLDSLAKAMTETSGFPKSTALQPYSIGSWRFISTRRATKFKK